MSSSSYLPLSIRSLTLAFCLLVFQSGVASAQGWLTCVSGNLWLSNGSQAAHIGKCREGDWESELTVADHTGNDPLVISTEVDSISAVKKLSRDNFRPLSMKAAKLQNVACGIRSSGEIRIVSSEMPNFVREFLEPHIKIVVATGWQIAGRYTESYRFNIQLRDENTLVRCMLQPIRINDPDKEFTKTYGDYYYLVAPGSRTALSPSSTLADYHLKDGSILRLFTSIR